MTMLQITDRFIQRQFIRYIFKYRQLFLILALVILVNYFLLNTYTMNKPTLYERRTEFAQGRQLFKFDEVIQRVKQLQNKSGRNTEENNQCKEGSLQQSVKDYKCRHEMKPNKASSNRFPCSDLIGSFRNDASKTEKQPILTLFTSWIHEEEKFILHNNTIKNWSNLKPYVIPVVFTNDTYLADECKRNGWKVLPVVRTAANGVPVLKHMFMNSYSNFDSIFYGFANSDILFTGRLVTTLYSVFKSHTIDATKPGLMIGQRTNVEDVCVQMSSSWESVEMFAEQKGSLFYVPSEDYFITNKAFPWKDIPEVVIGRAAYDNWIVIHASHKGYQLIDATATLLAVHQTTKYGNQEGFRHPEVDYNFKVLRKIFGKINYNQGVTICASLFTDYNTTTNNVELKRRAIPHGCASPDYFPDKPSIKKFQQMSKQWRM